MRGFVSDHNIEGHFHRLMQLVRQSIVVEIWDSLGMDLWTFADLNWSHDLPDDVIWSKCQEQQLVLVTNNRNHEDETSLEATIRRDVDPESLPVVTISSVGRFENDRTYAKRVAEDLIEVAFDILRSRKWLGSGRIFLPHDKSA